VLAENRSMERERGFHASEVLMTAARRHVQANVPPSLVRCDLPDWRFRVEDEDEVRCAYCGNAMDDHYDPNLWSVSFEDFAAAHEEAVSDPEFCGQLG
jgi:restriction system protein